MPEIETTRIEPFKKDDMVWRCIDHKEHAYFYEQTWPTKAGECVIAGYVVTRKKLMKAQTLPGGKSYPDRYVPCLAERDFGISAYQFTRHERARAELVFDANGKFLKCMEYTIDNE